MTEQRHDGGGNAVVDAADDADDWEAKTHCGQGSDAEPSYKVGVYDVE